MGLVLAASFILLGMGPATSPSPGEPWPLPAGPPPELVEPVGRESTPPPAVEAPGRQPATREGEPDRAGEEGEPAYLPFEPRIGLLPQLVTPKAPTAHPTADRAGEEERGAEAKGELGEIVVPIIPRGEPEEKPPAMEHGGEKKATEPPTPAKPTGETEQEDKSLGEGAEPPPQGEAPTEGDESSGKQASQPPPAGEAVKLEEPTAPSPGEALGALSQMANPLNRRALEEILRRTQGEKPDRFTFIVSGGQRGNQWNWERILEFAARRDRPLFAVNLGDFSLTGQPDEVREYAQNETAAGIPQLVIAGEVELASGAYSQFVGSPNFWFDLGDYRFIFLNNADGEFGVEDRYFLEQKLSGAGGRTSFVFMHFPVSAGPWAGMGPYPELEGILDILNRYHPALVMVGHEEEYRQKFIKGINFIAASGSSGNGKLFYLRITVSHGQAIYERVLVE